MQEDRDYEGMPKQEYPMFLATALLSLDSIHRLDCHQYPLNGQNLCFWFDHQ